MKLPKSRLSKQIIGIIVFFVIVLFWMFMRSKLLQQIVGTIIFLAVLLCIYIAVNYPKIECKRYIQNEVLPMFEKIETLYGAQYTTVMYEIRLPIKGLEYSDSKTAYIFVANEAFHIVSSFRPELHIILPFSEIDGHKCFLDGNHHDSGDYYFQVKHTPEEYCLAFKTIPNDLCKNDKRYNGAALYEFITTNFPYIPPQ